MKLSCLTATMIVRQSVFSIYQLHSHYLSNYATSSSATSTPTQTAPSIPSGLQKVDFTARYKKARVFIDELEEYFKLPPENFDMGSYSVVGRSASTVSKPISARSGHSVNTW